MKVVSERLGHTKISTTMDRYSHLIPSLQSEAAESLNYLWGK
ncbi:UNVERIFIED_ORG: integrase [Peribacillus simplex]